MRGCGADVADRAWSLKFEKTEVVATRDRKQVGGEDGEMELVVLISTSTPFSTLEY